MITDLQLLIGGMEWIFILFFGLFVILGGKRLPKFTKSIGKAVGEFQKARSDMEKEISRVNNPIKIPSSNPVANEREKLEAIAKALQINTVGKTDNELRQLISNSVNPK